MRTIQIAASLWILTSITSTHAAGPYDGEWPPYSSHQCTRAIVSGALAERRMSDMECNQLIISEGRPRAAAAAAEGGFFFYDFGLWDVNSAGGVEPHAWIVNPRTNDTLKYATIRLRMFNAVGDPIRSSIGGQGTFAIQFTGPLKNDDGPKQAQWEPVGYNHSAKCLQAESVAIEFMSGKKETFSGKMLGKAFHPSVSYTCKP